MKVHTRRFKFYSPIHKGWSFENMCWILDQGRGVCPGLHYHIGLPDWYDFILAAAQYIEQCNSVVVCRSNTGTVSCFSPRNTTRCPLLCSIRIVRTAGDVGKTTLETKGGGPQRKSNQLLAGACAHITEIPSMGNLTYPDLANILFAAARFCLDQLRLCSCLFIDRSQHYQSQNHQNKSNDIRPFHQHLCHRATLIKIQI